MVGASRMDCTCRLLQCGRAKKADEVHKYSLIFHSSFVISELMKYIINRYAVMMA